MSETRRYFSKVAQEEAESQLFEFAKRANSKKLQGLGFGDILKEEMGIDPSSITNMYVKVMPIREGDDLKQVVVKTQLQGHNSASVDTKDIKVAEGYAGQGYMPPKNISAAKFIAYLGAAEMAEGLDFAATNGILNLSDDRTHLA
jgi:glucose/arabinose dehydrogenase